ncbi:MAG: hypothetical protein H6839_16080 [Planctomycetes bacterium]|nr:hypothetical protein [Planctomycetota bacterium]
MKRGLIGLLLLTLAACGGGDPAANQSAAPAPVEEPVAEPEVADLRAAAEEVFAAFPYLEHWRSQVVMPEDLAAQKALWRVGDQVSNWREQAYRLGDEYPWKLLRALGYEPYRYKFEKEPSQETIIKALEESAELAEGMRGLREHNHLLLFNAKVEGHSVFGPLFAMEAALYRCQFLVAAGYVDAAVKEFLCWVEVFNNTDFNANALNRKLGLRTLEIALKFLRTEPLNAIASNTEVHGAVESLREPDCSGFWEAWRNEMAHIALGILAPDSEHEELDPETLTGVAQDLRARIQLAQAYGMVALDPTAPDVFGGFQRIYHGIADQKFYYSVAYFVVDEVRYYAAWMAYDLARKDAADPLLARRNVINETLKHRPSLAADLDEKCRKLTLRMVPDNILARATAAGRETNLVELELRKPPEVGK